MGGWFLDVDFYSGVGDLREWVEDGVAVVEYLLGDGGIVGLQGDVDGGDAVLEVDVFDESEGDDVAGEAWVGDLFEVF